MGLMEIEFSDKRLALIETEAAAETRLPVAVIHSARQRLRILRAATDVSTLRNWKSLGLRVRTDTPDHFVELAPNWAMAVKIVEKNKAMTVFVTSVEESPRGVA